MRVREMAEIIRQSPDLSWAEARRLYGACQQTYYRARRQALPELGNKPGRPAGGMNQRTRDAVRALKENPNLTLRELKDQFGLSYTTGRRANLAAGLDPHTKMVRLRGATRRANRERADDEVKQVLWDSPLLTNMELAAAYGMSRMRVARLRREVEEKRRTYT